MFFRKLPHIVRLPHIGMRKIKSLLAILIGFFIWQAIRLFFPDLEEHPVFIYFYGLLEIRDGSDKTKRLGANRIKATFIALSIGLPALALRIFIHTEIQLEWLQLTLDLILILLGTLLTLELGEKFNCQTMTGIAPVVYISLLIYHADEQRYIYSLLRGSQTIIGVLIAWFLNVLLFPYPGKERNETEENRK